jgi:hypothetical protein
MAIYYVPAVWKNDNGVITHVVTKLLGTDGLARGMKRTVAEVVQLINSGNQLYTARYMYDQRWRRAAPIHVVTEGGRTFLRSNHDSIETDNLDNMIPMHWLGF